MKDIKALVALNIPMSDDLAYNISTKALEHFKAQTRTRAGLSDQAHTSLGLSSTEVLHNLVYIVDAATLAKNVITYDKDRDVIYDKIVRHPREVMREHFKGNSKDKAAAIEDFLEGKVLSRPVIFNPTAPRFYKEGTQDSYYDAEEDTVKKCELEVFNLYKKPGYIDLVSYNSDMFNIFMEQYFTKVFPYAEDQEKIHFFAYQAIFEQRSDTHLCLFSTTGTGKTSYANFLGSMVGLTNFISLKDKDMTSQFGVASNKKLVLLDEARVDYNVKKRLKTYSSNFVSEEKKHVQLEGNKINYCSFIICSNEITDHKITVEDRLFDGARVTPKALTTWMPSKYQDSLLSVLNHSTGYDANALANLCRSYYQFLKDKFADSSYRDSLRNKILINDFYHYLVSNGDTSGRVAFMSCLKDMEEFTIDDVKMRHKRIKPDVKFSRMSVNHCREFIDIYKDRTGLEIGEYFVQDGVETFKSNIYKG